MTSFSDLPAGGSLREYLLPFSPASRQEIMPEQVCILFPGDRSDRPASTHRTLLIDEIAVIGNIE